ncbi:hypothetical protein GCM10027058_19220 [Microbacterium neimengense]
MSAPPSLWRRRSAAALSTVALVAAGLAVLSPAHAAEPAASVPLTTEDSSGSSLAERALKPYMGWSSFSMQVFTGDGQWINADQIMAQSDAMHEKLQSHGYNSINVDAGWNGGVDEYGRPTPSETLYPNGLQAVIDHVHANGQTFGLYFIPGLSPQVYEDDLPIYGAPECSTGDIALQPLQQADYWDLGYRIDFSNPCSQKYIDSIADMIGGWGVDFVKFDSVTPGSGVGDLSLDARDDVAAWSQALKRNDIWMELSWALDIRYIDYWKQYAQGWRIDWDVECYCEGEALTTWDNIARLFPRLNEWWRHGGPGGWNDLDSLNVGNGAMDGLTRDERRTAATLWAVSAAPMYVGNDLTNLDEYGLELLTNDEVIAVNQAGRPARPVSTGGNHQTWYSVNTDGSLTVAVFNLGRTDADITINWADLGLDGKAKVRDLWAKKNLGSQDGSFTAEDVPIHGARLFTVTPAKKSTLSLNDDDLRLTYQGDWQRNNGREVAPASQPLTVSVTDSAAARDAGAERTIAVNNDDPAITYSGTWSRSSGRGMGDYNDDVQYAEANGSAFEYTFVGTGIDYVTETHESQGEVEIYLDGQLVDTVDTSLPAGTPRGVQQAVYSVRDLPSAQHTLRAVKKSGQFMLLDKLDVVQESLLGQDEISFDRAAPADAQVTLQRPGGELAGIAVGERVLVGGEDYDVDGDTVTLREGFLSSLPDGESSLEFRFRGDVRGDVHATTENGAAVEFAFRGTSVAVTGPIAPDQGEVAVYIDGELVDTIDTSGPARLTQQPLFTSEKLKNRDHVLRLEKVSGDVMRVDAVTYTLK